MFVYLHNLGCIKNQKDGEIVLSKFLEQGFLFTNEAKLADVIVINTCAFINEAKSMSISETLKLAKYKKQNCKYLVMMGCLSQRYKNELIKELPEIDLFVGINDFSQIVNYIRPFINKQNPIENKKLITNNYENIDDNIYEKTDYLKILNNNNFYQKYKNTLFVKISEGCSNFCSYCAIPYIRGNLRYKNIVKVLEEIKLGLKLGFSEIVLMAQDLTADPKYLKSLLLKISKNKIKPQMLRLMYCNPWGVDNELINIIVNEDFICNYIDIPIQHISNKVLKKMNRKLDSNKTKDLIQNVYEKNIFIRSTVITGFPGEREGDFKELHDFIKKEYFMWLGVFTYSREENTKAYNFRNRVNEKIAIDRRNIIDSTQYDITSSKLEKFIGKEFLTISNSISEGDYFQFRTCFQAPEVDGVVMVHKKYLNDPTKNLKIKINESMAYDLYGFPV